jgi:hypothetical protein
MAFTHASEATVVDFPFLMKTIFKQIYSFKWLYLRFPSSDTSREKIEDA